jgi:hypothetical protein
MCEALESTKEAGVLAAFQRLFGERGMPSAIRSDNGLPFASPNGLCNLSKLSVWWLRLGVALERIRLTLKQEATRPAAMHSLQQQAHFDTFLSEFNRERPHKALAMQVPVAVYAALAVRNRDPRRARD